MRSEMQEFMDSQKVTKEASGRSVKASGRATMVSRLTGATQEWDRDIPNPNHTDLYYEVLSTDLGIIWDRGNGNYGILFGDTYGVGWTGPGAGTHADDWRSQVLGFSDDDDLSDGMTFSTMIMDRRNHAKELVYSPKDTSGFGHWTNIPTAAIRIGETDYMQYMDIRRWNTPGRWDINESELTYSTNDCQDWERSGVTWESYSNFAQMCYLLEDDGFLYMYSTPCGRFGDVFLARVPQADIMLKDRYEYWNGSSWILGSEGSARPVVEAPVAELSVQYNSYFGGYVMCYLNTPKAAIVIRTSKALTGPWSTERILCTGEEYPALYSGFIHPLSNTGPDLYFVMTQWDPYNSFLMKAVLTEADFEQDQIINGGFEREEAWIFDGPGGYDFDKGNQHTGIGNGFLNADVGWSRVYQPIEVNRNTNYVLTAYLRTSDNCRDGYLGVRLPGNGTILSDVRYGPYGEYTKCTVAFNSGENNELEAYIGMWAVDGETWIQVDDVTLTFNADAPLPARNYVADTGFELQNTNIVSSPWIAEGTSCGMDVENGLSYAGLNNAYINSGPDQWNAITQFVWLDPGSRYVIRAKVRGYNFDGGYFGVRDLAGTILGEVNYQAYEDYTTIEAEFDSGANNTVKLFVGAWATLGDMWVRIDDVEMYKIS